MRRTTDFLKSAVICRCRILPSFPDSRGLSAISEWCPKDVLPSMRSTAIEVLSPRKQ